MSIVNPGKLIVDLRAVLASITLDEMSLLESLQEVINERLKELEEDNGYREKENRESTNNPKETT